MSSLTMGPGWIDEWRAMVRASARLGQRALQVAEFRDSYFGAVCQMELKGRPVRLTMTQLQPRVGAEGAVADLFGRVARATGKASMAAGDESRRVLVTQFHQT